MLAPMIRARVNVIRIGGRRLESKREADAGGAEGDDPEVERREGADRGPLSEPKARAFKRETGAAAAARGEATMRQARRTNGAWMAAGALTLAAMHGCGGDGETDAPSISDLSYEADGVTTDGGMISGEFAFEDPDGNVIELYIRIRSPSGTETQLDPSMLDLMEDATSGGVTFDIRLTSLSQSGTWEFDVWVRDADGNDSNELTGTFEVSEGA